MRKRVIGVLMTLLLMLGMVPCGSFSASAMTSKRVAEMVSGMTLRDKVLQMMMIEFRDWGQSANTATDFTVMNAEVEKAIKTYRFGGVVLFSDNLVNAEQSVTLVSGMQDGRLAPTSHASRAQIATIIMRMHQKELL